MEQFITWTPLIPLTQPNNKSKMKPALTLKEKKKAKKAKAKELAKEELLGGKGKQKAKPPPPGALKGPKKKGNGRSSKGNTE